MSAEDFAPVERPSLAELVAKKILDMVRSGNLKPGEQLPPERELALMLQVSRPSVREALRGLQILGVLRMRQGGGIFVTQLEASDLLAPLQFFISLTPQNIDALYQARLLIDSEIARLAAVNLTDEDIARLRSMSILQKNLVADPIGFRVSDLEFHHTLIDACQNPFLERMAKSLFVLGMEYRRISTESQAVLSRSVSDHRVIVEALETRDPEAAAKAVARHLESVYVSTRAAMDPVK